MAEIIVRVPGVSTVMGEFSQHCQGHVLCFANSQNLTVRLSDSPDSQVHIHNSFTGDRKRFSLANLKFRKEDKWCNSAKGVFHYLAEAGFRLRAFDIVLEGEVLRNDSPTLVAAISVGICLALRKALGLAISDDDIVLLCYKVCTLFCAENTKYSTIRTMFEAKEGKFLLFDLGTLSCITLDDPFADSSQRMLVVDCRIPPEAMREEIRHRHEQAAGAFSLLKSRAPQYSIRDFPISELRDRLIPVAEETRRLCYTLLEDSLAVSSMQRFFERRDCIQIGKNLGRIGKMIRDDLELSCPEMDWMVKRAAEVTGCQGAGILFNGSSAYVLLVMDVTSIDPYMAKLEDYERIFGFKAKVSEVVPCGHWE